MAVAFSVRFPALPIKKLLSTKDRHIRSTVGSKFLAGLSGSLVKSASISALVMVILEEEQSNVPALELKKKLESQLKSTVNPTGPFNTLQSLILMVTE